MIMTNIETKLEDLKKEAHKCIYGL